jgi:hypothetical protein
MFGEEIDYEEEEKRYLEEQQRQLAELEKRNKTPLRYLYVLTSP